MMSKTSEQHQEAGVHVYLRIRIYTNEYGTPNRCQSYSSGEYEFYLHLSTCELNIDWIATENA